MAFGPGYATASAPPGTGDNTAIAGHRDTHFAFLEDIAVGEVVFLETPDGIRHRYQVSKVDVLHQSKTNVMERTGVKQLTLITCYPFNAIAPGGPMRFVVQAISDNHDADRIQPNSRSQKVG